MRENISQLIKKLNEKLVHYQKELKTIRASFKDLNNPNLSEEIKVKEKEILAKHKELSICQSEKEQILQNLNTEIAKVKNSNLSNEDKSQQIITLTTNNQQQFTTACQHLHSAWQSYH